MLQATKTSLKIYTGAAPRSSVASQIQNSLQFASVQIQNSSASSKEEISLKETSPKQSQIKL